ncbi:Tab2/Atab2 family RNA-binding protein [Spirulina sp. CS-785/01]|uniref:Tab2/Atab2 family RNA-binding protein n=1 Tax=Spirulina sp. CS-785/01 TaxID=3021716 RepID=UPI00232F510C|nr:Tab2/Atab2 family RNA-binding protein [Spirulina sp. CS-785/01]MDB9314910.1 Tab2/Atab2 family RNA-binding protein [Spirulina sp. CS-785/01]
MGTTIWELDFYSRPVFDENQKKLWEVLICESPLDIQQTPDRLFKFSKFTNNKSVNSLWLSEAIEEAIAQAPNPPKRIRFFRRPMNNMILKACEEVGIPAYASRRTYALNQWIKERLETVYPQQEGYDPSAAKAATVKYPELNASPLPDAVRGDKSDKWAFVTLEAAAFQEMNEWDIAFSEAFPLEMMGITPDTKIPGLLIFSPRAMPLAGWMSGLELSYLQLETGSLPRMRLETGASDSWILADLKDKGTLQEAQGFEATKKEANNVHFLAVQSDPESESFAGFWLLKEDG